MTKKFEQLALLLITVLFVGVMLGLYIARYSTHTSVQLSAYDSADTSAVESAETAQSNVNGKLNINLATAKQLAMLPGIGEGLAQRIVDYRQENGPFISIKDLTNVSGIGEKRLEAISEYITVGG